MATSKKGRRTTDRTWADTAAQLSRRRSERLELKLIASSITPRSGKTFAEEIARCKSCDVHQQLYSEAKQALSASDISTATLLFDRCPESYRNTRQYKEQCAVFSDLQRLGILQREETRKIRALLADMVCDSKCSLLVGKYAELVHEVGYTEKSLRDLTLANVNTLFSLVSFPEVYKSQMIRHLDAESSFVMRSRHRVACLLERCGGWRACLQVVFDVAREVRGCREEETAT